ncbi:AN1-type zinc finger protein 4-like [Trichoplusia ni]|uniref:AN1-type zinc finger protein 4-like n=1 Tax=Trichoplusia ni TaxID=7111 RepID=A0A7E5WLQ3_TRINI|nr:AN1-type zinc finger protein 4-like [Trichoplusia ni]
MSQHGCPERLSNRSKGFQDDGPSQSTMEVLVETLTGTAFEMTVLPTDTIFAIKSKIFRVEGIPVSQQHLLYNLKELEDSSSLREHCIGDGARLRLVLGMRGGPISTRRLPPPPNAEPWRDIERLLDTNRDDVDWGSSGCKVTVLVFRDGERVNMLRVKENHDGTYSPLEHNKFSSASTSLTQLVEREAPRAGGAGAGAGAASGAGAGAGSLHDNAVTMTKMLELRRRMEALSVQRPAHDHRQDKVDIQKTRSEETLSVPSLLDDRPGPLKQRAGSYALSEADAFAPLYDGNYTRYDYDCAFSDRYTLLPPLAPPEPDARLPDDILEECLEPDQPPLPSAMAPVSAADYAGPLVCGSSRSWVSLGGARGSSQSASSLQARAPPPRRPAPLADALFSSSTSDLEKLKRNSRILPALSRHRPREHLHLSDERLEAAGAAPPAGAGAAGAGAGAGAAGPGEARKARARCGLCRKRLSIATLHRCRCGGAYCAPHRYAEAHGCAWDYRSPPRADPPPAAPYLPRI